MNKLSQSEFIQKAIDLHGNLYDYSLVNYIRYNILIEIICKTHGIFSITPGKHLNGRGCQKCSKISQKIKLSSTTDIFVQQAKEIHGELYDYSLVDYVKAINKVKIICKEHGIFEQRPNDHISAKQGCPSCCNTVKGTTANFITKAKEIHGELYDYSKVEYLRNNKKIILICKEHGEFLQSPQKHIFGHKCPRCNIRTFSNKAIKWLDEVAMRENIFIQHAGNIGEYKIPSTLYRADGYCNETNTVYEFHGDYYHGNPALFSSEHKCHPFNRKISAGELYLHTINRENKIKELGYNLIVMWEHDFT